MNETQSLRMLQKKTKNSVKRVMTRSLNVYFLLVTVRYLQLWFVCKYVKKKKIEGIT